MAIIKYAQYIKPTRIWLPLQASSCLHPPRSCANAQSLVTSLKSLSKHRLSSLVALTASAGYFVAADIYQPSVAAGVFVGTLFTAFSASTFNQLIEAPFDSQMARTKLRCVPSKAVTLMQAANYGMLTGALGLSVLYSACGHVPASLSLFNIALYSLVYTPLKQFSCKNTSIGAIVGSVPPLIGWSASGQGILQPAAFVLPLVLFLWQYPHFNSLSWKIKTEYTKACYAMAAVERPDLLSKYALFASLHLFPTCIASCITGLSEDVFLLSSTCLNIPLLLLACRFASSPDRESSRRLFLYSLLYLPLTMAFLCSSRPKSAAT